MPVEEWEEIYLGGNVVKSGFAADMGDGTGSAVVLVLSLIFLCVALYFIVRLLHHLVLSSGRQTNEDGGEVAFVRYTKKVLGFNAAVNILFGMVMTEVWRRALFAARHCDQLSLSGCLSVTPVPIAPSVQLQGR